MSNNVNTIKFNEITQSTHHITVGYGEEISSYKWFDPASHSLAAIIKEVEIKFAHSFITEMVNNDKNLVITFENSKYIIEIFVESAE